MREGWLVLRYILLAVFALLLVSCGGKKQEPKPDWVFKPKSIDIIYHADPMLNEVNGASNALMVVVYQLDTMNKFQELAAYKDGLKRLLKAENFDPGVKAVKKVFINPGQEGKLLLDRAEGAKWVGIAAGYYHLAPGRVTCFFDIPHKIEKQGMIFFKKKVAVIENPKMDLFLEPYNLACRPFDEKQEKKQDKKPFFFGDKAKEQVLKESGEEIYKQKN